VLLRTDAAEAGEVGDVLAGVLDACAARTTLRTVSMRRRRDGGRWYAFRWFRDREFEISLDANGRCLRLHGAVDHVLARSSLDRALRAWLRSRQSSALAEHRRLDPARVQLTLRNSGGAITLSLQSLDGDLEYAMRKLVHLLNELYLDFLATQAPFDWLIESFGLDPDNPVWP